MGVGRCRLAALALLQLCGALCIHSAAALPTRCAHCYIRMAQARAGQKGSFRSAAYRYGSTKGPWCKDHHGPSTCDHTEYGRLSGSICHLGFLGKWAAVRGAASMFPAAVQELGQPGSAYSPGTGKGHWDRAFPLTAASYRYPVPPGKKGGWVPRQRCCLCPMVSLQEAAGGGGARDEAQAGRTPVPCWQYMRTAVGSCPYNERGGKPHVPGGRDQPCFSVGTALGSGRCPELRNPACCMLHAAASRLTRKGANVTASPGRHRPRP